MTNGLIWRINRGIVCNKLGSIFVLRGNYNRFVYLRGFNCAKTLSKALWLCNLRCGSFLCSIRETLVQFCLFWLIKQWIAFLQISRSIFSLCFIFWAVSHFRVLIRNTYVTFFEKWYRLIRYRKHNNSPKNCSHSVRYYSKGVELPTFYWMSFFTRRLFRLFSWSNLV